MLQYGLIKQFFWIIRTTYKPLFLHKNSLQQDFLPQVKISKEYLPEHKIEYLLLEHYNLVEKGAITVQQKVTYWDTGIHFGLRYSDIMRISMLFWICSLRNSRLFLKELTFKCAMIKLFKFFLRRALRFGFPTTSSQILGYDSFTSELFEILENSSLSL